ncbi:major facilitator superfamily domain-containing protein [Lipomyces tetrasporus]|uniref:Major facilitator superfamily domain-containing protein n=1 Tax=Lipomyces tetrasporus TaxID=54092 RepID=A0AAD7QVW9_9ASCO|nr:major facilitator superfamily domain-containing protein [Lipomyces tetrasporus]KAJ8102303.1 major facilitator superfamily domain-containing protein [Lipomyces tetrasporus]
MPFGILDPKLAAHERVPGTVHLYEAIHGIDQFPSANLKRQGNIILVPQPSDSPNDPLNWTTRKKDFVLFIICLESIMASTVSPILASSTIVLVLYFKENFQRIALLTGWHLVGAAIASVFVTAIFVKYGKRFPYVFASAVLVGSSAWAAVATSYKSLLGARILQGVALAPFEVAVFASVGDMYFVHQRGVRLALVSLSIFGTTFLTPIITGTITKRMGWHWMFWFVVIFSSVTLVLVILFVPEHVYNRDKRLDTDVVGEDVAAEAAPESITNSDVADDDKEKTASAGQHEQKESYLYSLRLFSGSKTARPLWKIFLRPFALFLHPAIIWGCLTQGTLIAWTALIGVVLAAVFMGPPLWFDEVEVGYMYTGAFVGAIVGFVLAGVLSDFCAKWLSRHNNNIYEPEFRILLVIPQMICGCIGVWGFGYISSDMYKYSLYLPPFFFGLETCGMILGAVASASYITDAHRDIQIEAFVSMLLFKNLFSFALTDRAYPWLLESGVKKVFTIIGAVQLAVSVVTLSFWIVGKWNRYIMHRYDLLRILHLE